MSTTQWCLYVTCNHYKAMLSPYKLNANKHEASSNSVQLMCMIQTFLDSSFGELSSATCFVNILLARAKILYMTKFSLDKNFAKPSYLCIAEIFGGVNFRQCGKGRHVLNVIINTGQKIRG